MHKDLKKRIYTSIILFLLLYAMAMNNYILGYFLIIIGIYSIIEFFNIISLIPKIKRVKYFLINFFFITYIFIFCTLFLILSSYLYLKIVIFIILLTCVASDVGGFVFGKFFKGPKLTKISPKKTISGAIGSIIFSLTLISTTTYYLTNKFDLGIFIIGLFVSIGCQLGDLFISFLKRKSSIKDTGKFLPGHGGILDRIDGMLIGVPIGLLTLLIIS